MSEQNSVFQKYRTKSKVLYSLLASLYFTEFLQYVHHPPRSSL